MEDGSLARPVPTIPPPPSNPPNCGELFLLSFRILDRERPAAAMTSTAPHKEHTMDGNLVGMVAVIMIFGIPMAAMYTFYHVRKLRTEERMAALARGVNVPMQPELSEGARSRRSGILLVTGSLGYMLTFALIARAESDAWIAAAFGIIPLSVGLGYFLDSALIRRDLHA
jgi:hypothetical protein